jgi:hypothetical protein
VAKHAGRQLDALADLRAAERQRRDRKAGSAVLVGLLVRAILAVAKVLPSAYRWPVAVATFGFVFVGLSLLDTRYMLSRRMGEHERTEHRR